MFSKFSQYFVLKSCDTNWSCVVEVPTSFNYFCVELIVKLSHMQTQSNICGSRDGRRRISILAG